MDVLDAAMPLFIAMSPSIDSLLQSEGDALAARWQRLQKQLGARFGEDELKLETILFLIGIQSMGRGYEPDLEKETKQDFIMEGTYCAFETLDLYERIGADEEGRWIWERTTTPLPKLGVEDQEKLLRLAVLRYFDAALAPDV